MPSNGIIMKNLLQKPTSPKGFIQAAVYKDTSQSDFKGDFIFRL